MKLDGRMRGEGEKGGIRERRDELGRTKLGKQQRRGKWERKRKTSEYGTRDNSNNVEKTQGTCTVIKMFNYIKKKSKIIIVIIIKVLAFLE